MKKSVVVGGIVAGLLLSAAPASAQWMDAACPLSGAGHFLVNSGKVYLEGASEESDEAKRDRLLADAHRNFLEAIERGEDDNPAVWYYLGRYYVLMNDGFGADSAFDRVMQMEPDCDEDMWLHRRMLWVPLINEAIDSLGVGATEGAKLPLYHANAIFDEDIIGFYYLGRILGAEGELDSAIVYFKRVAEMGTEDSTRVETLNTAIYNIGLIYGMLNEWDSSAVWYERHRLTNPNDLEAMIGLAKAYAGMGDERGPALYDSVLAQAEAMDAPELFRTGESLFVGGDYHAAARAFEMALERNRYFRPGLYNLVNTYLAICQDTTETQEAVMEAAASMEVAARRLMEVDPKSYDAASLLAASYQIQRLDDSTLAVLERMDVQTWSVEIDVQQQIPGGFNVEGRLLSMSEEQETETSLLTFEFVDGQGAVIATDTLDARTLGVGEEYPFGIMVEGAEIVAVRYREGG
jgi:tetratricopeptide (TPR) repeat protein